jgi:hypothetical protein
MRAWESKEGINIDVTLLLLFITPEPPQNTFLMAYCYPCNRVFQDKRSVGRSRKRLFKTPRSITYAQNVLRHLILKQRTQ